MNSAAKKFKVNIVGGDVSRSGKIVIDVSLLGEVERSNLVTRSGAKIGDLILVTGCLGGSIKGRHLDFIPRVEEARRLVRNFKINSMIDISDGLILDLGRILRASKAGAKLYQNAIPVSKDADSFEDAVSGGEDFELLFTMGLKEARRFFKTELRKMKTPVTLIGEIVDKKEGYKIVRDGGKIESLRRGGYLHF
jgi:thiamine-monophosphate kinase